MLWNYAEFMASSGWYSMFDNVETRLNGNDPLDETARHLANFNIQLDEFQKNIGRDYGDFNDVFHFLSSKATLEVLYEKTQYYSGYPNLCNPQYNEMASKTLVEFYRYYTSSMSDFILKLKTARSSSLSPRYLLQDPQIHNLILQWMIMFQDVGYSNINYALNLPHPQTAGQ